MRNQTNNGSFISKYTFAVISGSCAETVTYPLDITKTRMQIKSTIRKGPVSSGMLKTGLEIARNEGIFGLWSGISPALYRHTLYAGIRLSLYETLRDDVIGKDENGKFPLHKAAVTGFVAGGVAQFSATPLDLVRIQIQMDGRRRLEGKQVRINGVFQALRNIWNVEGFRGLWRGWIPNTQRGALVNLGDFMGYDCGKRILLEYTSLPDSITVHVLSSFVAGLSAAVMATPADVISTRMMNQSHQTKRELMYKGSIDCLRRTVKAEGMGILYKGFLPIWMRLAPAALTFWVVLEQLRKLGGMGGF